MVACAYYYRQKKSFPKEVILMSHSKLKGEKFEQSNWIKSGFQYRHRQVRLAVPLKGHIADSWNWRYVSPTLILIEWLSKCQWQSFALLIILRSSNRDIKTAKLSIYSPHCFQMSFLNFALSHIVHHCYTYLSLCFLNEGEKMAL